MDMTDAAAVRRVLDGDSDAFSILVSRYGDRYVRYASQMLGNREDAEEALQDAFVRAFRSIRNCEDPSRFGAWLFQILINRCRTAGARRGRREQTFVRDEIALMTASSEHPADNRAMGEEIHRALAMLDADQREAFLLKHVEGLSYEEISEVTGAGVSALKMRVKRACDHLKVSLQEVYFGRAG
jgi:RNA polymerase sigma-70 factor (ECF subfamily)